VVAVVIAASVLAMLNNRRLGAMIFFGWPFFDLACGALILELGIVGLFLDLALSISILLSDGRVLTKLEGPPWFPVGFVIFRHAFLFLTLFLWPGFQQFEDFILHARLWFSLGLFFRLPSLPVEELPKAAAVAPILVRYPRMA
jgi:hypothetical protein